MLLIPGVTGGNKQMIADSIHCCRRCLGPIGRAEGAIWSAKKQKSKQVADPSHRIADSIVVLRPASRAPSSSGLGSRQRDHLLGKKKGFQSLIPQWSWGFADSTHLRIRIGPSTCPHSRPLGEIKSFVDSWESGNQQMVRGGRGAS